jgi:ADP-ribose pyrophosphatase YjhB (NUDIX family)
MDPDQVVAENGVQLLASINDDFGGVIVEMKEHMDSSLFLTLLRASMSQWKLQGKKGVWIKLPIGLVNLVETAVKEGFWYHHAEPEYLMLAYWIPETGSTIPINATHRVGVGAIVLNQKRELLVVLEKNGVLRGKGMWKIPTGIVDLGEDIFSGAIREVKEETGIDTEFVEILAFRQFHKSFFGKSDLFFLCMMRPLSFEIEKQDLEIEAAQWMPFDEYAALPYAQSHSLFKYITDLCLANVERGYTGFTPQPATSHFSDQVSYIYLNAHDLDSKICNNP